MAQRTLEADGGSGGSVTTLSSLRACTGATAPRAALRRSAASLRGGLQRARRMDRLQPIRVGVARRARACHRACRRPEEAEVPRAFGEAEREELVPVRAAERWTSTAPPEESGTGVDTAGAGASAAGRLAAAARRAVIGPGAAALITPSRVYDAGHGIEQRGVEVLVR